MSVHLPSPPSSSSSSSSLLGYFPNIRLRSAFFHFLLVEFSVFLLCYFSVFSMLIQIQNGPSSLHPFCQADYSCVQQLHIENLLHTFPYVTCQIPPISQYGAMQFTYSPSDNGNPFFGFHMGFLFLFCFPLLVILTLFLFKIGVSSLIDGFYGVQLKRHVAYKVMASIMILLIGITFITGFILVPNPENDSKSIILSLILSFFLLATKLFNSIPRPIDVDFIDYDSKDLHQLQFQIHFLCIFSSECFLMKEALEYHIGGQSKYSILSRYIDIETERNSKNASKHSLCHYLNHVEINRISMIVPEKNVSASSSNSNADPELLLPLATHEKKIQDNNNFVIESTDESNASAIASQLVTPDLPICHDQLIDHDSDRDKDNHQGNKNITANSESKSSDDDIGVEMGEVIKVQIPNESP